jgi:hypothetical protein
VVYGMELVAAQQLSQLARVDPVTLVAILQKRVLSGIADHQPAHVGFQKIV